MTIDEAVAGITRRVIYFPFEGCKDSQLEFGMIVSVKGKYVFVLFDGDIAPKATLSDDISFELTN